MEQYINKAAVVAEIERLRMHGVGIFNEYDQGFSEGRYSTFEDILSFLDTLEVQEVDLEKEIKSFTMSKELYEADSAIKAVAEHFFELGLKAQKGE